MANSPIQIKLLLLFANVFMKELSLLNLGDEEDRIRDITLQAPTSLSNRGIHITYDIDNREAVTTENIKRALQRYNYRIVHFAGHGYEDGKYGAILLGKDAKGQPKELDTATLRDVFKRFNKTVDLVVLNACYTEGVAEILSEFVPVVVGTTAAIGDQAAIAFSKAFYTAYLSGYSILDSFEDAKADFGVDDDEHKLRIFYNDIKPSDIVVYEDLPQRAINIVYNQNTIDVIYNLKENTYPEDYIIEWDFGDGTPKKQGKRIAHTYEEAKRYTIEMFVFAPKHDHPVFQCKRVLTIDGYVDPEPLIPADDNGSVVNGVGKNEIIRILAVLVLVLMLAFLGGQLNDRLGANSTFTPEATNMTSELESTDNLPITVTPQTIPQLPEINLLDAMIGLEFANPVRDNTNWYPIGLQHPATIDNTSINIELVLIPVGRSASVQGFENSEAFWIQRTETTNLQYNNTVEAIQDNQLQDSYPQLVSGTGSFTADSNPRDSVSFPVAEQFCTAIGGMLPTENQWEFAAAGPSGWGYPYGRVFDQRSVVLAASGRQVGTEGVFSRLSGASWTGATHMTGNVFEWTQTLFQISPQLMIAKGGSWCNGPNAVSICQGDAGESYTDILSIPYQNRQETGPEIRSNLYGVRCLIEFSSLLDTNQAYLLPDFRSDNSMSSGDVSQVDLRAIESEVADSSDFDYEVAANYILCLRSDTLDVALGTESITESEDSRAIIVCWVNQQLVSARNLQNGAWIYLPVRQFSHNPSMFAQYISSLWADAVYSNEPVDIIIIEEETPSRFIYHLQE